MSSKRSVSAFRVADIEHRDLPELTTPNGVYAHETLGVRKGQRGQEHPVHEAEDGGIGADTEREGENGDDAQAGSADEPLEPRAEGP